MMTYLFSSSVVSLGQAQLELREMPKTPCNLLFKYSYLSTLLFWLIYNYNLQMHINIWKASVRNRGNSPLGDWVCLHAWHKAMIFVRLSLQQARLHAHKLLRLSCFMAELSVKFSSCILEHLIIVAALARQMAAVFECVITSLGEDCLLCMLDLSELSVAISVLRTALSKEAPQCCKNKHVQAAYLNSPYTIPGV